MSSFFGGRRKLRRPATPSSTAVGMAYSTGADTFDFTNLDYGTGSDSSSDSSSSSAE